jgi:hypothetical protein
MTVKMDAAEALAPMLSHFHAVADRPLQSVWQFTTEHCVDKIILNFGTKLLVVTANEDDDSLELLSPENEKKWQSSGFDQSSVAPWSNVVGKVFGWGWITVNQQGYCDGLLLSFQGIVPNIALNVIASSLKVGTITMESLRD